MNSNQDYLWDRSGEVEPDVRELERVMGSLRHHGEPPIRRSPLPLRVPIVLAAVALVSLALIFFPEPQSGGELTSGTWIRTANRDRHIHLPEIGEVTIARDSELQVQTLSDDLARFYLKRGRLSAFVYADVRERFFQVDTPSALCVDLGCKYELSVSKDGSAFVRVTFGQVAFANGDREVYIPSGAACRADPERGAGLPFFEDSSVTLRAAIEAYERVRVAGENRRPAVDTILRECKQDRDSLTLYHLLDDADASIAGRAQRRLADLVTPPVGIEPEQLGTAPDARMRASWREVLELLWW